jgi:hypothetical protein
MKNWKDFDWTDSNGNELPPEYIFAALDKSGFAYAFEVLPYTMIDTFVSAGKWIACEKFEVENWKKSLTYRKDYKKESDKSAFTEENFLEFIEISKYDCDDCAIFRLAIEDFKNFLESRKPLPQEVTDAMAVLEKHGYKFTKGN